MKKKKNTKPIMIPILRLFILLTLVGGVGYFVIASPFLATKVNSVASGYLSFHYTENESNTISLKEVVPVSLQKGKKSNDFYEFTVLVNEKERMNYEILLEPIVYPLDYQNLKIYLTDEEDQPFPEFVSIPSFDTFSSSTEGKIIYRGQLTKKESKQTFRLRIWVSDQEKYTEPKNFSFHIFIKEK